MRHKKRGKKLGRNASHRKAMFRNMANSLFEYEKIVTTAPKAKALRPFVEKLITLARTGAKAYTAAEQLREKASDHDKQASDLLVEANRKKADGKNDERQELLERRKLLIKERYELLAEWRKAVAPALHVRRQLIAKLGNRDLNDDEKTRAPSTDREEYSTVIQKLMGKIGPHYYERPGGYTQILRLSKRRLGDAGENVMISLVTEETAAPRRKRSAEEPKSSPSDEAQEGGTETAVTPAAEASVAAEQQQSDKG